MNRTATAPSAAGEVAFRGGVPALAWAKAHAGARAFSAGADPIFVLSGLMAAGDALAVTLAAALAYILHHGPTPVPLEILSTTLLGVAMTLELMRRAGTYTRSFRSPLRAQIGRVFRIWTFVTGLLLGLGYVTAVSNPYARLWAPIWYGTALVGLALVRVSTHFALRRWRRQGRLARTVAIVEMDRDDRSGAVAEAALELAASEVYLVGVFSPLAGRGGEVDDLIRLGRLFRIDDIMLIGMGAGDAELIPLLRRLGTLPANVSICTAFPRMAFPRQEATTLFGFPVLTVYRRPLDGWGRLAKRVEDVALATALLAVCSPLMLLIAAAVRLDSPGPALFRQKRVGFNNDTFEVLKFRTMHHRAVPEHEVPQARPGDPRVTRVGRWLRRTSLDELPQLINVQRGNMSLIGPRPHALPHDKYFSAKIDGYLSRHRILPGITGWAQVNGFRGETETLDKMQRRVDHDLAYIEDWSLLLDLRILWRTLFCLFSRDAF
jgi:putative colanic acid biosynthesis UDP-glucose lipid carrier transferase